MSKKAVATSCKVSPDIGTVTWSSEGMEGGKYHSRKLHVPTSSSGLTLGRGYDLGMKNSGTVVNDLTKAGVAKDKALLIAKAVGLKGDKAKEFITKNKLEKFEISECGQKQLFDITYQAEAKEAKRLCEKADVTKAYGKCDWVKLELAIQEMLVDLKFRGDYNATARKRIQKLVSKNDFEGFVKVMTDKSHWKNVPKDRFDRRKKFLENALLEKKKADKLKPPTLKAVK